MKLNVRLYPRRLAWTVELFGEANNAEGSLPQPFQDITEGAKREECGRNGESCGIMSAWEYVYAMYRLVL